MERIIKEIGVQDFDAELFMDAQFIMWSEWNASGEPGCILIMTADGNAYHSNYLNVDTEGEDKMFSSHPAMKDMCVGASRDELSGLHKNWRYRSLSEGNFLLIRDDVIEQFVETFPDGMDAADLYVGWLDAAWEIIEQNLAKNNKEKLKKGEWKKIYSANSVLLYEGYVKNGKPYGEGKSFYPDGTVYQDGIFDIKGLIKGKEYYPSGQLRFEGTYKMNRGYGPNYPDSGKCYSESGELMYEGKFDVLRSGLGYPMIQKPKGFGAVVQHGRPEIEYMMWND